MGSPTVIDAGEYTAGEVLTRLKEGEHLVVRTEFLGSTHDITLRWDGETYYCDTPTRLHRHDSEAEMLACIEEQGYAASEGD